MMLLAPAPRWLGAVEVESGDDLSGELVHFDRPLAFTADDLLCATAETMGKSTYGTVYKGHPGGRQPSDCQAPKVEDHQGTQQLRGRGGLAGSV